MVERLDPKTLPGVRFPAASRGQLILPSIPIKAPRRMTPKAKSNAAWRSKATRIGELLPPAHLHPAVLAWAEKRHKTEVWSVAFSGGSDSVALLLLLWAHWPTRRGSLVALHFNHRLRGRESTADEMFCRKVCAALGIRLRVGRWARGGPAGDRKTRETVSEAEARTARHAFFSAEMNKLGSRGLWLGHQQDDIAESILMRLARGSGLGGLAAPRPVHSLGNRRTHLRPLLTMKKAELVTVLRKIGVVWREDRSNAAGYYFRNRVRNKVLPAWLKAAGRDGLAGAARSRELLEEDDAALEAWAGKLAVMGRGRKLDIQGFGELPRAVTRRVLHRWLLAVRPESDLSRQGFELLLAAIERERDTRFSVGRNGFAVIGDGQLFYKRGS